MRGELGTLGASAIGTGEALMFGGVLSWVVYTLVGRSIMRRPDALSPLATTAYASTLGLLLLAAAAAFELPQVQWSKLGAIEFAALAYMGVFGTAVAFVWFYEGVKVSARRAHRYSPTSCRCSVCCGP